MPSGTLHCLSEDPSRFLTQAFLKVINSWYSISMSKATFEERYEKLNKEQKKAVDTIDGPVLVVAGPGSGKTEILSLRVANILRKTDIPAGGILCLTFTDSAAVNMRERLSGLIGTDAYRVSIHTFHSFGVSIINRFPEFFFGSSEFNPADTVTQIETLSEIFKELSHDNPLKSEHPEKGYVFLNSVLSAISNLKRAGLTPEEFEKIINHNEEVLELVNPLIDKVFTERLSKDDIPTIKKLSEDISKVKVSKFPVSHLKSLSESVSHSLKLAVLDAEEQGKTTPLSAWKTKWTESNDRGQRVLKETERLPRMKALVGVYSSYRKSLFNKGYYDFDDMLLETIGAIESQSSLELTLQEEFQYILVDEFQDTNDAQMRLLRLLTSADVHEGRPNIMAVGDDDQAIYKFQGAEVANIMQFKDMFRDPTVVTLSKNYRSTQDILDIAQKVVSQGSHSLRNLMPEIEKNLKAGNLSLPETQFLYKNFQTELHQFQYIAKEVKKQIKSGIDPKEIALISRTHSTLQGMVPYLRAAGIPVEYDKQQNVLDLGYIRELLSVVRFVDSVARKDMEEADHLLPEILSYSWWGIPRKAIWDISVTSRKENKSWLEVMQDSSHEKIKKVSDFLISLGVTAQSEPLERIMDLIIGSVTLELPDSGDDDREEDTLDIVKLGSFESPFRQYYFGNKVTEHKGEYISFLSGLRVFIQTLREYKQGKVLKVSDLVELLNVYEKNHMEMLDTSPFVTDTKAVRLLTSHKAKGLEFEVVFVLSATDDIWTSGSRGDNLPFPSNLQVKPSSDNKDDVLRLFYVALTRAKHTLYITAYEQNAKGKQVLPVEFLGHLTPEVDTKKVSGKVDTEVHPLESVYSRLSLPPYESSEKAMLEKLVEDYQMSVTHLNNFLDVSKGGPKIFLEQNLLRFPQAKNISNVYGTAMHATLQYIYTYLRREGEVPKVERALEVLEKQVIAGRLSDTDTRIQIERGEKALKLYYKLKSDRFNPEYKIETDFKHEGVVVGSARLTGKIDKMVVDGSEIEVYDFKTGKPKASWNERDLFNSTSSYNYKRQLIFYKLLVEGSKNFSSYKVNTGVLEFLEPQKGELLELPLNMDKDEVTKVSKLAEIVYKKIVSLDFPDTTKYSKDLLGTLNFEDDLLGGKV